ncbi:type IV toxin-antitoxin system AbiEi family antitoxin domain-containing protein [Blastococcus saxobsidens]|uniref:Type IV toxin-antitoxin system AbiEi family antitoxin domain-containing protein n=1 Tax=Blastococcus saxobsidens TaxID=138336 RepID=A0A6L9W2W7_9ACTN|nr:type IV toxin-antitoxin system AbiEi family antitoxin domain-containing protein [Blastococcus saxobsidens]NEK86099.1 type IV toxin-antitoxin system AbiEi family antitoxin domain-containing protein [Blastococcus saxobsidens]
MHPLLRAAAERRLGLFTAADARRAGYGHPEIRSMCATGRWVRLRRGIYVAADDLARAEQQGRRFQLDCLAVLVALDRPGAALGHGTAARLWGLPVPRPPTISLVDPAHTRTGRDHRMTQTPLADDEVAVRGPFRLTTPARTLVDHARSEPLEEAVVAMDAALLAERVVPEQLRTAASRAARWPGARRAERAVVLADGRAESPLETRGRLRIAGAGLPVPELQVEIRAEGRLVAVVDAWFDDAAVAVEFDRQVKYTDPWRGRSPERVLWEEKRREDRLRALDIGVVRIADADVGPRWPDAEADLRRALARPAPLRRRFSTLPRARGQARTG